jgi:hypothetical protein
MILVELCRNPSDIYIGMLLFAIYSLSWQLLLFSPFYSALVFSSYLLILLLMKFIIIDMLLNAVFSDDRLLWILRTI